MRRPAQISIVSLSVIGIALASLGPAAVPTAAAQAREPLCRRPAALPALPPEPKYQAQQQHHHRAGGGDYAKSVVAPMPPPPPPPSPPPPPPPPPMSPDMSAEGSADIAVTGARVSPSAPAPVAGRDSSWAPAPSVLPPYPRRPQGEPQSGLLTAGDHDDLLNPDLYANYVRAFLRTTNLQELPRLDTRRVLTVAVQDGAGRPVPFARVTITCADGNSLSLATVADGTAVFFPGLDRLGDNVRLSVAGSQGSRTIELAGQPGSQRHNVTLSSGARAPTKFDLMLTIDTTGSMGDEISYLKSELRTILADLKKSHPQLDVRLGLVVYRDIGDAYVTRTFPFTSNLDEMQTNLRAQYADGGGDYPEAMEVALHRAVAQEWRPDAVKSMLLVADAPPHDQNVGMTWRVAEAARAKRIQIVPVAASGVGDLAEYVMRSMASATQSRYIFLTDDSGIGNPHAPPAVDCYLVTRLDRLVRRVLDSQISGRRVEPREGEVIRSVGRYDGGKCVLPPDYPVAEQF